MDLSHLNNLAAATSVPSIAAYLMKAVIDYSLPVTISYVMHLFQ